MLTFGLPPWFWPLGNFWVVCFFFVSFGGCYFDFVGVVVVLLFCCFVVVVVLLLSGLLFFLVALGVLVVVCFCCFVVVMLLLSLLLSLLLCCYVVVLLLLCCCLFVVVVAASPKGQQHQTITENIFMFQYVWDFLGEGCSETRQQKINNSSSILSPSFFVLPSFLSCFPLFSVLRFFLSFFLLLLLLSQRSRRRRREKESEQQEEKEDKKKINKTKKGHKTKTYVYQP